MVNATLPSPGSFQWHQERVFHWSINDRYASDVKDLSCLVSTVVFESSNVENPTLSSRAVTAVNGCAIQQRQGEKERMSIRATRSMRNRSSSTKPLVQIGKQGVTVGVIDAIDNHLERKQTVKVRVLKTGLKERKIKDISREIMEKTGSDLVEVRGHTFILHRGKGKS